MTPRQYLEQALVLHGRVEQLTMACDMLQQKAESIQSPGFEPRYGGGSGEAPYIRAVEKLAGEKTRLKTAEALLKRLQEQMTEVIGQLDREEWQDLLRYRYVYGEPWKEVAAELFIGMSTVYEWHQKAVQQLPLPENAIDIKRELRTGRKTPDANIRS